MTRRTVANTGIQCDTKLAHKDDDASAKDVENKDIEDQSKARHEIRKEKSAVSLLKSMLTERERLMSFGDATGTQMSVGEYKDLSNTFAAALSELSGTPSQTEEFSELVDPHFTLSDLSGGFHESLFRLGSSASKN